MLSSERHTTTSSHGSFASSADNALTTLCRTLMVLKKAQCESVETTVRKRRLLFVGGVQRTTKERLTHRLVFGTFAGGENPGPGSPEKNWG